MTIADTTLLDNVSDLSLLSNRQLLERLVRTSERIELNMTAESDYIAAAMGSLDTQLANLGTRLDAQAQQLAAEAQAATDLQALKEVVNSAAAHIQDDAVAVSQMAPSQAADPGSPVTTPSVPTDPSQPIDSGNAGDTSSTTGDTGTPVATDPSAGSPSSSDAGTGSDTGAGPGNPPSDGSTSVASSGDAGAPVDGGASGPLPPVDGGDVAVPTDGGVPTDSGPGAPTS